MRRALISDIHGNYEALEVVLDDIQAQGITEISAWETSSAMAPTRASASTESWKRAR